MKFDYNKFADNLESTKNVDVDNHSQNHGWHNFNLFNNTLYNQVVEYTYSNGDGDFDYRTWYQETSFMKSGGGMLISVKIDFERVTGDDHIILIAAYSMDKALVAAQASVQISGNSPIITPMINSGNIVDGIYNSIKGQLKSSYGIDGTTDGRHTYPDVTKINLNAMTGAVTA
jgi:hypothetical protein